MACGRPRGRALSALVGVIPAAGRGTRAYPYTRGIPKCLLEVDGVPVLARVIATMTMLGIKDIVVITGDHGEAIVARFGDGSSLGVNLTYVANDAIEKGLSYSLLLARPYVPERACVMLADECYLGSNHAALKSLEWSDCLAVVGVAERGDPELIHKNYAVRMAEGMVTALVEKPRDPGDTRLGVGTFLFHRRVFDHLEQALEPGAPEPRDPVSVLGRLCAAGERIRAFEIAGEYVNINNRDALNLANALVRAQRFEERSVALAILHRGSSEDTVRTAAAFLALGRLRHVKVVVPPGTELGPLAPRGVEVVVAGSAEAGVLLLAGLDSLQADILAVTYGDGTFAARDLAKLLEYLKDADVAVGTRTTRQLVDQGTNMRGIVRFAHILLAKALECMWWGFEPRFTDVGCAYRAIWSTTYRLIRPRLEARGPESFVEMLLETLACRRRVIEIPVSFHVRHRGLKEREQTWRTAVAILALITRRRLRLAA